MWKSFTSMKLCTWGSCTPRSRPFRHFTKCFLSMVQSNRVEPLITLTVSGSIINGRGQELVWLQLSALRQRKSDFWELPCQHGLFYHQFGKTFTVFASKSLLLLPSHNLAAHHSSESVSKCFSHVQFEILHHHHLAEDKVLSLLVENSVQEVTSTAGICTFLNTYRAEERNKIGFAG